MNTKDKLLVIGLVVILGPLAFGGVALSYYMLFRVFSHIFGG